MKKTIFLLLTGLFVNGASAQSSGSSGASESNMRFGLRITPQPTWFTSTDKNATPSGARFGFGFGLNVEFKINRTASFLTGIGGDFEGAKYKYRNDPGQYSVYYELNESGEFVKPVNGYNLAKNSYIKTTNTGYLVKDRTVSSTYITIPVLLKLSTSEYSGLKYFGMFGGELAFRAKAQATDSYYESYTYGKDSIIPTNSGVTSQSKLNIGGFSGDAAGGIFRVGLNVGLGVEYRLGGSTSFFANINYFKSFTNFLTPESKYLVYKTDQGKNFYIKQYMVYNAIRINLGFMF